MAVRQRYLKFRVWLATTMHNVFQSLFCVVSIVLCCYVVAEFVFPIACPVAHVESVCISWPWLKTSIHLWLAWSFGYASHKVSTLPYISLLRVWRWCFASSRDHFLHLHTPSRAFPLYLMSYCKSENHASFRYVVGVLLSTTTIVGG